MVSLEALPRMYESLADHFARQGESRQRDQCLVLAADAALSIGMPEEAERLRRRLLLTNPHHLVRPYASMAEAMKANDVRDLVADLRKQWPPENVEKLVQHTGGTIPLAPIRNERAKAATSAAAAKPPPVSALGRALAFFFLLLGLLLAGGLLVIALAGPWLPL